MKRWFSIFCICLLVLTACSHKRSEKAIAAFEKMLSEDDGQTYVAAFDTKSVREYIDIIGTKLLYMEVYQFEASFYMYDFRTETTQELTTVSSFAIKGGGKVVVNQVCYFYIGVYRGNNIKNVLYAVDFVTNEMYSVSDNMYSAKMIPLISINDQVVALQGNNLSNDDADTFLEIFHENGDTTRIDLMQNDVRIPVNQDKGPYILSVDSDAENIYAIEMTETGSEKRFFLTKYTSDYSCTFVQEITSIFTEHEITTAIGEFYASGDYFYLRDFSGNGILCRCKDQEIQAIFNESYFNHVDNSGSTTSFEYFYIWGTNDIYQLNTKTGTLEIQSYDLDNENSVINYIIRHDNRLMIEKKLNHIDAAKEIVYIEMAQQIE